MIKYRDIAPKYVNGVLFINVIHSFAVAVVIEVDLDQRLWVLT